MAEELKVNGVPVETFKVDRTIVLPSGKAASIKKGKGRDMMQAQKALGSGNTDANMLVFALIAELVRIDGQAVVVDQVLDMDLADVLILQKEVVGDNFLSLTEQPLQH